MAAAIANKAALNWLSTTQLSNRGRISDRTNRIAINSAPNEDAEILTSTAVILSPLNDSLIHGVFLIHWSTLVLGF